MSNALHASPLQLSAAPARALAVFDLDRTLVPGSSLARFARVLGEEGILRRRELAGHLLREAVFAARGLGPAALDRLRASLLRAATGVERSSLLEVATAYADSASDLPVLRACGSPVAVNPDRVLRAVATSTRWPILDLS